MKRNADMIFICPNGCENSADKLAMELRQLSEIKKKNAMDLTGHELDILIKFKHLSQ